MNIHRSLYHRYLRWMVLPVCLLFIISSYLSAGTLGLDREHPHAKHHSSLSADGPYLFYRPDGSIRLVRVDLHGEVTDTVYSSLPADSTFEVMDHKGHHRFWVKLHAPERPAWQYAQPAKVFVMSDPHGKLDEVVSLLRGNGIIDRRYSWTFGTNHLVVIGDVMDRGKDVTQIYWLLYKLEAEARRAGGQLSFLLGNHESMVAGGDVRYMKKKYLELAKHIDIDVRHLYGVDTELGRWLATRNVMQVIGTDLYVHAGLSLPFFHYRTDLPTVNRTLSEGLFLTNRERGAKSRFMSSLYSNKGPLWYRGLVRTDSIFQPMPADSLPLILSHYGVNHIIVGHTVFDDISTFYGGSVIGVNVDAEENREHKRGRAVLIEGNRYTVVGDKKRLRKLKVK